MAPQKKRSEPKLLAKVLSGAAQGAEEVRDRILSTAVEQISDFGVRGFTIDELAKRVGLSRVTIYRHFPSKRDVLEAALLRELAAFIEEVRAVVEQHEGVERRAVEGFVFAMGSLRQHEVLQRLLRTEPELILPLLTTQGAPVIEAGREFIYGLGEHEAGAGNLWIDQQQLTVLSELLTRTIISLVLTPESVVSLDSEEQLRAYAEEYIVSIVRGFASLGDDTARSQVSL
ncbi:MAG: TetR/AcrR family transcriptional regulator [Solirubrobacterales bacterium]|nr:TetR/AcrR family transcriptional regulator [Solirubrobacterales bacterium]